MDTVFPFGFPLPTAFYLCAHLGVLMVHIVFMNYVLAGAAYLAGHSIFHGKTDNGTDKPVSPIAKVLRDWMPFMLSAAITAGIAPLLFLQVLYRREFYTANLLLFYRWMAILPVLIAGFYLAYLLKSKRIGSWPLFARAIIGIGMFACFGFVGWSWVENHLLSINEAAWVEQYQSASLIYRSSELLPRLSLWFIAAFPTMALMVAWQLYYLVPKKDRESELQVDGSQIIGSKQITWIALVTIVLTSLCAGAYYFVMPESAQQTIISPLALPFLGLTVLGTIIEIVGWLPQLKQGIRRKWLIVVTVGLVINFIGMAVINESTRLAALDITMLYERHAQSAQVGGKWVFLIFFLVNLALMGYSIRLTKDRKPTQS